MTQPKYKFGDKVKTKVGSPFIITAIKYDNVSKAFYYFCDSHPVSCAESQLELVVEPMEAEFDYIVRYSMDELVGLISSTELHKFIGKKVYVKVTEVL